MSTITAKIKFEVNSELKNLYQEHLENMLNGFYLADDKKEVQEMLEDLKKPADKWKTKTKKELVNLLLLRAGFTVNNTGDCAEFFKING